MVSKLFSQASKAMFRVFREDSGAYWLREGQSEPNYIDCHFIENWQDIDADGVSISDATARATFEIADILAIDPTRTGQLLRNEGRDKFTIGGKVFTVESCTADGHGWINVLLIGPVDGRN